jgi:type VI secretion system ImpA family protein
MAVLEELLSPVSDDAPGGKDVFYGEEFANLIALRERRDQSEDRAWAPDWEGVADTAKEILEEQSKDIRVALYMSEALLQTEGFSGFHAGLEVVREILERYPDQAHPEEAEDRAYALDFLVGALQADTRQSSSIP